ncbi:hypothetical protein Lfu02_69980 [Longispora fulva]|nr:hypothetical protein Lfu02_69980 [Longispora fulva]
MPSAETERQRLNRSFQLADFQPTGWSVPASTALTVTVDRPDGSPVPDLVVGVPGLGGSNAEARSYPLRGRTTTITDPAGGALHVRTSSNITVTLGESAKPLPLYRLGTTTPEQWRDVLASTGDSPIAQLASRHVVLTVTLPKAREHAAEAAGLMAAYDQIVGIEDTISGQPGPDDRDKVSPLLYYISEGKADTNPDANDYRVHWPADLMDDILTPAGARSAWGLWHELGHLHQQSSWEWDAVTEVTVNVYSLAVERALRTPPRLTEEKSYDRARAFLALPDARRDYNALAEDRAGHEAEYFTMLVMFEQLRLGFGEDFYPKLHQAARAATDTDTNTTRYLMVTASRVAGADLTGFFTRWGLRPDADTRAQIAALRLPQPRQDLTTLHAS